MKDRIDPSLLSLLKIQLNLTRYQASSLVAIIYGKSHPSTIADFADIPRPKVYAAIKSLEELDLIVKTSEGDYEPNPNKISALKEDGDKLVRKYNDFIRLLSSYSSGPSRIMSHLKKEVLSRLQALGYVVETTERIRERLGPEDSEKIGQWVHRYYRHFMVQQKYGHLTVEQRRRPWRLAEVSKLRNMIVHGRYTPDDIELPEFIAESPNSGIRIGIVIRPQEIDFTSVLPAIYATFDALGCNAGVVIRSHGRESVDEHDAALGIEVRQFFLDSDYAQDLVDFLNELDLKWSQFKDTLNELLDRQNELKQRSETLKHNLTDLLNSGSLYPNDYKSNFEDILTRIRNDSDLNQQLLFQLDELIEDHFRSLHRKELFPIEDLRDIEKRQKTRAEMLEEKEKEIRYIKEEFYSIPIDKNPYVEYGFKINPFSLTVPLERPTMIVNQSESKNIAQEFIEGVIRGSDSNLLLIVGNQGVGKSHFLNYFANQINILNFGKALAVKIRCKTNQDMLDLYPQITEALKKALVEKKEFELMDEISKILADRGTPRLVQDLMGVLKEIQTQLSSKGYQNSFIFVDELENSISSSIQEDHLHINDNLVQRRRSRSRGTPQSISQLGSLTRLPGIGFILTLRKNDWSLWEEDIKERVNKIENKYIINIEPLSLEDSKEFLTHRLKDEGFKTYNNNAFVHMGFNDDAIELIWRKGQGNPRAMLRFANTAFRKSVDKKMRLIHSNLVE